MSYSHDHHKDNCGPDPYSYGNISMCAEPDYMANDCDDQLPPFSVIGRGPRGEGVIAEITKQDDSTFMFKIESDETGETVIQSPNLHAGKIAIYQPNQNPQAGEAAQVSVSVVRDGKTSTYFLKLPPGAPGAFMFTARGVVDKKANNTYVYPIGDIAYDGNFGSAAQPTPRVNDMVIFITEDPERMYMSIGHIEAVESGNVVVTTRNYLSFGVPEIGPNGNWFVSGVDTGQPSVIVPIVTSTNTIAASGQASVVGKRIDDLFAMDFNIPRGTTFTPTVDPSGNISFQNDGNKPNPTPINIKGPKGDKGDTGLQGPKGNTGATGPVGPAGPTIQIMDGEYRQPGSSKDLPDLPAFADTSEGTAYVVDDDAIDGQYDLYIHGTNGTDWTIIDNWAGVPGPKGTDGHYSLVIDSFIYPISDLPDQGVMYCDIDMPDFSVGDIVSFLFNVQPTVPSIPERDTGYFFAQKYSGYNQHFYDENTTSLMHPIFFKESSIDDQSSYISVSVPAWTAPGLTVAFNIVENGPGVLVGFSSEVNSPVIPIAGTGFSAYNGVLNNNIVAPLTNKAVSLIDENLIEPPDDIFDLSIPISNPHILGVHSFGTIKSPDGSETYEGSSLIAPVGSAVVGNRHILTDATKTNYTTLYDAINDQVNKYIDVPLFVDEGGDSIYVSRGGLPLAAEAAFGLAGVALGTAREMKVATDFKNITDSGVWYVPDVTMMTDCPVNVPGKFISDKDHFGIHHTYIAENSRIFMRHRNIGSSPNAWTGWKEVGLPNGLLPIANGGTGSTFGLPALGGDISLNPYRTIQTIGNATDASVTAILRISGSGGFGVINKNNTTRAMATITLNQNGSIAANNIGWIAAGSMFYAPYSFKLDFTDMPNFSLQNKVARILSASGTALVTQLSRAQFISGSCSFSMAEPDRIMNISGYIWAPSASFSVSGLQWILSSATLDTTVGL